jgi:HSP20 family protein
MEVEMNVHKLKDTEKEVKKVKTEHAVPAAKEAHDNPFVAFRREMDKLFDDFFTTKSNPALRAMTEFSPFSDRGALSPQVDLTEEKDRIVVTAELPGMKEKDVELTLKDGVLTIKGEKKSETKEERDNMHVSERRYGSFLRSFRLPKSVDDDSAKAEFKDGVLTVTLPKRADDVPEEKKIKITAR